MTLCAQTTAQKRMTKTNMTKIKQIEHFQTHVHTFCLLMPAGDFLPPYIMQCWFKSPEKRHIWHNNKVMFRLCFRIDSVASSCAFLLAMSLFSKFGVRSLVLMWGVLLRTCTHVVWQTSQRRHPLCPCGLCPCGFLLWFQVLFLFTVKFGENLVSSRFSKTKRKTQT